MAYSSSDNTPVDGDQLDKLTSLIVECRSRKKSVEDSWILNHAAWHGRAVEQQYHSDKYHYFVPLARKSIESYTRRVKKIEVPGPRFFNVRPMNESDPRASMLTESVYSYLYYILRKRTKVRRLIGELSRTLLMYGVAALKTSVEVYQSGGMPEIWPKVRAVDPFCYYVYPETAYDQDDRLLVFEDHMMPYSTYAELATRGVVKPINQTDLDKPEWPDHHVQRLTHQGISAPSDIPSEQLQHFVSLTEAYYKTDGIWLRCWIAWNVKGGPRFVRGPKETLLGVPYRDCIARPLVNERYTNTMMDDIRSLQVQFNDETNKLAKASQISAFPPVAADPTHILRTQQLTWGDGQIWKIPPEAVAMMNIPDTSVNLLRNLQTIMGLMGSVGGNNPLTEGQPVRGMPRAGFAANRMFDLSLIDVEDIAQILEEECLEPTLSDIHTVTKIFVPPEQIIKIPGTQEMASQQMLAQDLKGEYAFEWLGSLASQDNQMRAQRLITLMDVLGKLQPLLFQGGYKVNWVEIARTTFRDAMGERGLNQIIMQMSPQEIQQYQMMVQMQQMIEMQNQANKGKTQHTQISTKS